MEQHRIWDHLQTIRIDSFDQARGQYAATARLARRQRRGDGRRVLNIGICPGSLERLLHRRGWQVAVLARLGLDARHSYAQRVPFDSACFDVVVASEVLKHAEPATRAELLAEVARVLVPGGWLVGSVPYREVLADNELICPDCGRVFHRWGHVSSFDLTQLQAELSTAFQSVGCRRRSFVDWAAARTAMRMVKAVVQNLLGPMGEPIVSRRIVFAARKQLVA